MTIRRDRALKCHEALTGRKPLLSAPDDFSRSEFPLLIFCIGRLANNAIYVTANVLRGDRAPRMRALVE